jgi:hypothetical protein
MVLPHATGVLNGPWVILLQVDGAGKAQYRRLGARAETFPRERG